MVFLLTHLCEIDPVFSRISLAELKKARHFSFRGKNNKEAAPGYTFGFVVAQTIKQLLKTKQNRQPRLACTWIQSPENDRENQKVSPASASRYQPRKPVQHTVYMSQFYFYHIFILDFGKPRLAHSRGWPLIEVWLYVTKNGDSDFSVVRDVIGTCYISFLVHPGWSPCNTVAECFRDM